MGLAAFSFSGWGLGWTKSWTLSCNLRQLPTGFGHVRDIDMNAKIISDSSFYRVVDVDGYRYAIGNSKDGAFIYDKSIQQFNAANKGVVIYFTVGNRLWLVLEDYKERKKQYPQHYARRLLTNQLELYLDRRPKIIEKLKSDILEPKEFKHIQDVGLDPCLFADDDGIDINSQSRNTNCGSGSADHIVEMADDSHIVALNQMEAYHCYDYDDFRMMDYESGLMEEQSDYNDSASRSHEDGWFYSEND